jgi:hypothetical protein
VAAKALITSMLAAILGAASLGWQIYSWLRYRPRIIVTVAPARPGEWQWEPHHGSPSHLQVTATNRGHRAAYIKTWGLRLHSKSELVPQPTKHSFPLPYELQPDAKASWWTPSSRSARRSLSISQTSPRSSPTSRSLDPRAPGSTQSPAYRWNPTHTSHFRKVKRRETLRAVGRAVRREADPCAVQSPPDARRWFPWTGIASSRSWCSGRCGGRRVATPRRGE